MQGVVDQGPSVSGNAFGPFFFWASTDLGPQHTEAQFEYQKKRKNSSDMLQARTTWVKMPFALPQSPRWVRFLVLVDLDMLTRHFQVFVHRGASDEAASLQTGFEMFSPRLQHFCRHVS